MQLLRNGYSSTKSLVIAKDIPREAVLEFSENSEKYPGINIAVQPVRKYESGSLASHILGYADKIRSDEYEEKKDKYGINDIIGRTGIEYVFEEYLKGKNGVKQIDMSVDGTITAEYVSKEAVSGSNVVLTIDANLQKIVENALANNIQKIASGGFGKAYNAKAGSCVVMNVQTGEVLAMASYPAYNPEDFVGGISNQKWNQYSSEEANKPLYSRAIQSANPPGSIFKMITGLAGLETGVVTLNEKINDTGIYKKYNGEWKCWYYTDYHRGHGWNNILGALQKSCNYFFLEVADRMGIDNLSKYAKHFGLGSKTGIELPGETSGTLAQRKEGETWYPGSTLNASIGQGDNRFTTLQMAKYISMISNGGKNVDVTIIKSIINADGTEASRDEINKFVNQKLGLEEEEDDDIQISSQNLNAILEGMKSVTSEVQGTAYNIFKNFSIQVGGKTGSAEAGKDENGNDIVHAWFAGFAPFDNPEIAIVVMVENGGHGNYTAEVVRDIMAEYFGMNMQNVEESMQAVPYVEIMR